MNYDLITTNAFRVASNYISDDDSAREIAQLTAIECFLNRDKLNTDNLNNWIFTVAKNKSLNFIRDNKRQLEVDSQFMEQTLHNEFSEIEKQEFSEILNAIPVAVINLKDRKLLLHAFKRGLANAAGDLNVNLKTFRSKIYRIKQEILLFQKLKEGIKRTDPIPGTKLHHNLLNCIKKIKASLETKNFGLFDEFEIDDVSRQKLEQTDIHRIVKYQLDILKKKLYQVFVAFFDKSENINSLRFQIKTEGGQRLQIISVPEFPKKIVKIKNKDIPAEMKEKLKPGKDGLIPLSREELYKELVGKVKKIEVIYDLEE